MDEALRGSDPRRLGSTRRDAGLGRVRQACGRAGLRDATARCAAGGEARALCGREAPLAADLGRGRGGLRAQREWERRRDGEARRRVEAGSEAGVARAKAAALSRRANGRPSAEARTATHCKSIASRPPPRFRPGLQAQLNSLQRPSPTVACPASRSSLELSGAAAPWPSDPSHLELSHSRGPSAPRSTRQTHHDPAQPAERVPCTPSTWPRCVSAPPRWTPHPLHAAHLPSPRSLPALGRLSCRRGSASQRGSRLRWWACSSSSGSSLTRRCVLAFSLSRGARLGGGRGGVLGGEGGTRERRRCAPKTED